MIPESSSRDLASLLCRNSAPTFGRILPRHHGCPYFFLGVRTPSPGLQVPNFEETGTRCSSAPHQQGGASATAFRAGIAPSSASLQQITAWLRAVRGKGWGGWARSPGMTCQPTGRRQTDPCHGPAILTSLARKRTRRTGHRFRSSPAFGPRWAKDVMDGAVCAMLSGPRLARPPPPPPFF